MQGGRTLTTSTRAAAGGLDRWFRLRQRNTSVRTEVIAGLTTFMTMAYILFVNPSILSALPDRNGTTLAPEAVLTVTALAAGIATIAMGAYSNYPFALAAGLGLNAVVAFQLVGSQGLTWPEAMGVIVTEGIIILILVLTRFRVAVMEAVPLALKQAIAVGIGLFIAIIGFVNAGFVNPEGEVPLELGTGGELQGWPVFIFIIGLLLTLFLYLRGLRGSLLIGILVSTVLAIVVNETLLDGEGFGGAAQLGGIVAMPSGDDFELIGNFSFGYVAHLGFISAVLAVFTIMLADFFDTMGTAVGLGREAEMLDSDGRLPDVQKVLLVDSGAAALGGAFSASSNTTYIESASGIADGGRTGLTSMVVGVLFLLAIFFSPLAGIIPAEATAPALVVVGLLMMMTVRDIPWGDLDMAIPAFFTIVLMPFTYSITNGIGAGFITYVFVKLARGKGRDVHPLMFGVAAAFVIYFAIFYVRDALT